MQKSKFSWQAKRMVALLMAVSEASNTGNEWLSEKAPAKVNLMLSVHGRREDGFHALTSLVVACEFGDTLAARISSNRADALLADGVDVPVDDSNLVLKAANLFREATGCREYFDFELTKRIPVGAGLGGGSSDAVAALKLMDALAGTGIEKQAMSEMAASLGSDCPFFIEAVPSVMRGRGELIEPLPEPVASRLRGQGLVLFRPPFGVQTAWAYGQLAAYPDLHYTAEKEALERIDSFIAGGEIGDLLDNSFESAVGAKYLAIPSLLEKLRADGYKCLLSGSGSCCFALVQEGISSTEIVEISHKCWGDSIFWVETSIC